MTPAQQRVYDAYPTLSRQLVEVAGAFMRLPLDDMLVAVDRIIFNGTVVGGSHGIGINVASARNQKKLIEAAITFRDAVNAVANPSPLIVVPS